MGLGGQMRLRMHVHKLQPLNAAIFEWYGWDVGGGGRGDGANS